MLKSSCPISAMSLAISISDSLTVKPVRIGKIRILPRQVPCTGYSSVPETKFVIMACINAFTLAYRIGRFIGGCQKRCVQRLLQRYLVSFFQSHGGISRLQECHAIM